MATRATERRHEKNRTLVANWLAPIGTVVTVKRANGTTFVTATTSRAFLLDGAHAFVQAHGIPGNTRLSRVTPIAKATKKDGR
jgi:hypothetical protein